MDADTAAAIIGEVGASALLVKAPKLMSEAELRQALLDLEREHAKARSARKRTVCELLYEVSRAVGLELARRVNPAAASY
jgi:site-specific recombinase XerD